MEHYAKTLRTAMLHVESSISQLQRLDGMEDQINALLVVHAEIEEQLIELMSVED